MHIYIYFHSLTTYFVCISLTASQKCAVVSSSPFQCLRPPSGWIQGTSVVLRAEGKFIQDPLVLDNFLFVRKAYLDILDMFWAPNACKRFLLLGTPGIGKTIFGFMVAHEAVFRGRTVVYIRDSSMIVLQGTSCTLYASIGIPELKQVLTPDCILIVDGMAPPPNVGILPFFTLLISSPRSQVFNEFAKTAQKLVLPPWSLEELEDYRTKCHAGVSSDDLVKLFDIYGGVARSIFPRETVNLGGETIQDCVKSMSLDKVKNALDLQDMDKMTSRVIHLYPKVNTEDNNYMHTTMTWRFASDHIFQLCMNHWIEQSVDQVNQALAVAFSGGELGVLEGYLFEKYVHNFLAYEDLSFCRWKCSSHPGKKPLKIKTRGKVKRFSSQSWAEVFQAAGKFGEEDSTKLIYDDSYFRPLNRNFPSFDSAQGRIAYQITASESNQKACTLQDLKLWLSVCRKDARAICHIVKVVPQVLFDKCDAGLKVVTGEGCNAKQPPKSLRFWVLGIPFEEPYDKLAKVLRGVV